MMLDLEHFHHWMQAVRQSPDPMRTLDAFWQGQMKSKLWLIDNVKPFINVPVTIDIHGGWVGTLSSLIFQSGIPATKIRSIDIDPSCALVAINMNKPEEIAGKFEAVTADMCEIHSEADVIINTSCEHISQVQYNLWLGALPNKSLLVLQSNNYDIPEHVRTANTLTEFIEQSQIEVLWSGSLELPLYTRWMIIGRKNV